MTDVNVDFLLQDDEPIRADFEVEQDNTLVANILVEGSNDHNVLINRGMDNQHPISAITDLQDTLDTLHGEIGELGQTIGTYGDIVTHNTDEFATAEQGALANTALQPNDNISELVNDSNYATETYVDNGLSTKQDVISDLSTIREGASLGATAVQRVETGNSNGSIRVDGRDVAVKGLGSAAYTESTDYDVAGSASTAEANAKDYADSLSSNYATSAQGALADTALQPNDNISELNNDVGYITSASLPTDYVTTDTTQTISGEKVFSGILSIPAGKTYIIAGNGGAKLGYFTYDIDGYSNITLQTMTASSRDINFKTNNSGKVKYKGKEIAIKEDIKDGKLALQRNGVDVGEFTANQSTDTTINITVPTQASDIGAMPDTTTITDLTTTAQLNALNSGATTTNIGQITTNENDISDINDKIPSQASSSNQLADKNFVNSSIATNTANFIGTFNSVADLEAYSGTLTNNDYAFVQTTDSAGNTLYDRYKWNGSEWLFEYELNNSSFTASQWATINSGATSSDVALAQSALQPNDNVSELVNDAGYITSASLPTVNDATLTIQKNGVDVQTFTANQSTNATANITVPTDTSDLTNGAGFITGITSGDVTTALGYTPYDSSNPSGYITGITSGDITSALGYTPADDSGVVKTTGNQSIAGTKTFTGNITSSGSAFKRTSNIDPTTTSGETEVMAFQVVDKNGRTVASYNGTRSGTSNTNRQRVTNPNVSGANWFDLRVIVSDSAFGYASIECGSALTNRSLSYATSSTTLTYIPTMGWVNNPDKSTNVVHRSGTETITGQKTFNSTTQPQVVRKNANQTLSTASSEVVCTCSFRDSTDTPIGVVGSFVSSSGSGMYMQTAAWANSKGIRIKGNYSDKTTNFIINTTTTQVTAPTDDNTTSTQIDTVGARNTKINSVMNSILPTGTVLPYGGSSAPTGFLLCDGSAVSRTTYADLYAVIGDTYGSGDGSTTFNVPNLSTAVLPSSSTVSVVGNGNALGIVDDISTEAKQHNALVVGSGTSSLSTAKVPFAEFNLANPLAVGDLASNANQFGTVKKALGVSTLPQWSGLTGSITGVSVNYIIKV